MTCYILYVIYIIAIHTECILNTEYSNHGQDAQTSAKMQLTNQKSHSHIAAFYNISIVKASFAIQNDISYAPNLIIIRPLINIAAF